MTVKLPDSNSETVSSPSGGLPEVKPLEPHPTIANWYRCEIVITDVVFQANVHVDDTSQYREKFTKEENFHKQQWENQVPRAQGGCQDLWTAKGMKYWIGYVGTGQIFVEASTPAAAEAEAYALLNDAVAQEGNYCTNLVGNRDNTTPRYCFSEQVAKGPLGADFKEAYTLPCAYPSCTTISNDTHIAWQ